MTKAIAQTYSTVHEYRRHIASALFFGCALSVIAYAFNVYSVVSHTVEIGKIESRVAEVTSEMNVLDAQYLELSSAITPDTLSRYGFVEGKVTAYITRTAATASLSRTLAAGGYEL